MNEKLMRRLGWLGLVSLLSYATAVVFSPIAYTGYDWLSQAVSDLSADSAPSRVLWNQLAALYTPCGIVCVTLCCVSVRGHFNRTVRIGTRLLQKADFDMPLLVLCYMWMTGLDADKLKDMESVGLEVRRLLSEKQRLPFQCVSDCGKRPSNNCVNLRVGKYRHGGLLI